jgi:hypothetical protein
MNDDHPKPDVKVLIGQLTSTDLKTARKSLLQLGNSATLKDLAAIIRTLAVITDPELRSDLLTFISDIKYAGAAPIIAEALVDPDLQSMRTDLVRSCWESQLNFAPHLLLFVHLFITGDYALAVEAFTVIEYTCIEHGVEKGMIEEMLTQLNAGLPDQPESKRRLAAALIQVLENDLSEA